MPAGLTMAAVYVAAALMALAAAHRGVRRIPRWTALILALGPLLLTGKAFFTGGVYAPMDIVYSGYPLQAYRIRMVGPDTQTPLLSDVAASYIPSRKAVREAVRSGELPLWNRFSAAGEPLLAFQQPAVLHPGTVLGFLLPLPQAWTLDLALRLLLAMLSAYLFFRELECGEPASILGGLAWALCDHLVFFLGFSVTAALAPFPLLLLGLRRIARAGRNGVGATVAALVLTILAGHPESVLHVVIGGGVYFLFELARLASPERWRAVRLSLLPGALALGLTAVVLLPFAEIVPSTAIYASRASGLATSRRSTPIAESVQVSLRNFLPYVYGVSGHGATAHGYGLPAGYAGSLLFPLALVGWRTRRRERWVFLGFLLLGWAFWARLVGVVDIAGKLPLLKISVNDYFVFLASFAIVALAVLGLQRLGEGEAWREFAVASLATVIVLTLVFLLVFPNLLELGMVPRYIRRRAYLQFVPLALAAAIAVVRRRGLGRAGAWLLLALFTIPRALEAGEVYPTFPSRTFYPEPEILRAIPRGIPARTVAVGHTLVPDSSALFELEDVRGYEALYLNRFVQTYPFWCIEQPVWFNRVDDPTTPFLSFLNVRYVVAGPSYPVPPGWRLLSADFSGKVIENPKALPRVFVPKRLVNIPDSDARLRFMGAIADFGRDGVIEEGAASTAGEPRWADNGPGNVRIEAYRSDQIVLTVDAAAPTVVATSIPLWPGWKVRAGDEALRVIPYDNAFVSFRVPAGRRVVKVRYRPDGFTAGVAVTIATSLACVALLRRRRASVRRRGECRSGSDTPESPVSRSESPAGTGVAAGKVRA